MVGGGAEGKDFKTSGVQIHGFSWYVRQLLEPDHLNEHTPRFSLVFGGPRCREGQMILCTETNDTGYGSVRLFQSFIKVNGRLSRPFNATRN